MSRRRGFTLVEVLVGVAIAAVLASIAYPAYTDQINKGRVATAVSDIINIEMALDKYFTVNNEYPATLSDAGIALNDPWGNPYQYLRMSDASPGQVRKDKSLHPLNSDYDLCSMGPDGKTNTPLTAKASRDDIIRANNGSFVGPVSSY